MSSTYLDLNYHIVFSTKNRIPLISSSWSPNLHRYMGGIVKGLGGMPLNINGTNDHVHLLVGLRATHCLSDFVRELKKASTKWVKLNQKTGNFAWQKGYAALTVSTSIKGSVNIYISRQEEHHKRKTFQEELIELLKKAGIDFDPRFMG
jgi:putative transposase